MIVGLAFLALLALLYQKRQSFLKDEDFQPVPFVKLLGKYGVIFFVAGLLGEGIYDSVVVVPAGNRGVVFDQIHGVQQYALNEGVNFITPFIQKVILFDVRVQKDESEASASSKDLQMVSTKVALNLKLNPKNVFAVYQQVGPSYLQTIVHPAIAESVKAITAKYTAEELITRREEVKNGIAELLAHHLDKSNIELVNTYITDFAFSRGFSESIEAKQIAEQTALKAKRDLDRVRIEAEQKIASARAEAESLKMQKEAITTNLLELRAIEKWDGVLPIFSGSGGTPFIDLTKFQKKSKQEGQ